MIARPELLGLLLGVGALLSTSVVVIARWRNTWAPRSRSNAPPMALFFHRRPPRAGVSL